MENLLPLFVAVPLGAAFINLLISKLFKNISAGFTLLVVIFQLLLSLRFYGLPAMQCMIGGWQAPIGNQPGLGSIKPITDFDNFNHLPRGYFFCYSLYETIHRRQ